MPCPRPLFISFAVIAVLLLATACGSSLQGQKLSVSSPAPLYDSGFWKNSARAGIVIASRFNYYDERQYEQLLRRAETELHASFLTSVYVAWYGMNERPVREWSEFAILQDRPLRYETTDSLYVGSTLIYRIAEQPSDSLYNPAASAQNTPPECEQPGFNQRDIAETASCWHARSRQPYSEFDAYPAFVEAKQQALASLSQHLGIRVQQMDRQGEVLQSIVHQHAKYVFRDVHVSRLIIDEQELSVYISVPKDRIIKI